MASRDHTARPCPSEPFWLGDPPRPSKDPQRAERYTYLMKIAGTALAIHVIRNLLRNSEAFHRAKAADKPPQPGQWPLSPTQANGLHAALYFLRRHGDDMLMAEQDD